MDPYLVLGVPPDANDRQIRQAYLDALKTASPDRDPKRFQAINAAYERIKDRASRHRFLLFDQTPPGESPLDVFQRAAPHLPMPKPLGFERMKDFLRACVKT
jgi:curved DNA-binding protein CbpA